MENNSENGEVEEPITNKDNTTEEEGSGEKAQADENNPSIEDSTKLEHIPTRQSQRVKDQGLQGIKIAYKAMLAAQKKNLQGNQTKTLNSFAVLNNNELVIKSKKWELILKKRR